MPDGHRALAVRIDAHGKQVAENRVLDQGVGPTPQGDAHLRLAKVAVAHRCRGIIVEQQQVTDADQARAAVAEYPMLKQSPGPKAGHQDMVVVVRGGRRGRAIVVGVAAHAVVQERGDGDRRLHRPAGGDHRPGLDLEPAPVDLDHRPRLHGDRGRPVPADAAPGDYVGQVGVPGILAHVHARGENIGIQGIAGGRVAPQVGVLGTGPVDGAGIARELVGHDLGPAGSNGVVAAVETDHLLDVIGKAIPPDCCIRLHQHQPAGRVVLHGRVFE